MLQRHFARHGVLVQTAPIGHFWHFDFWREHHLSCLTLFASAKAKYRLCTDLPAMCVVYAGTNTLLLSETLLHCPANAPTYAACHASAEVSTKLVEVIEVVVEQTFGRGAWVEPSFCRRVV